jgi:HK97 family phage major capsid protein
MVRLAIPRNADVRGEIEPSSPPAPSAVAAKIEAINKAFEEFKAANDKELAEIKKAGAPDVVTSEKVTRINDNVTTLQQDIKALASQIAVASVGTSGDGPKDPKKEAYLEKFRAWVQGRDSGDGLRAASNALSVSSDPDGGFLVPDEVETVVNRVQPLMSTMRSLAEVRTMSTNTYRKPFTVSGATSGWVTEKQPRPETATPQLSELQFEAHEVYAMPSATSNILDDAATNMEEWLGGEIAISFNEREGGAFISGTGAGQPKGFLTYAKVTTATWGSLQFRPSGVAADLSSASVNGGDALLDLVYLLKPAYRAAGAWIMNDLTTARVRKFKNTDGDYIWQPGLVAGQPATLLGYPVASDDNMPDVAANAFPIGFGDWRRGYLIADRIGLRILRDPYTAKPYILFYTTKRVGAGVQNFEAIKLLRVST